MKRDSHFWSNLALAVVYVIAAVVLVNVLPDEPPAKPAVVLGASVV